MPQESARSPLVRPVGWDPPLTRDDPRFDADDGHRNSGYVRVEYHGGVGVGHIGPPLEYRVVLVDHRTHDRTNIERLLAVFVGHRREDVANGCEVAARMYVRKGANVTVHRVGTDSAAREAFSRSDIRVVIVCEKHFARCLKVRRPVLSLTVGSHHAVIAADAEVVLCRNSTGVIKGLLAGEDHRAIRRHDQNALGVHQHRRFGVPIQLRADDDYRYDDHDLFFFYSERVDAWER